MQFLQKLLSDRNSIYAERLKVRAQDDKHAERAAKQAEQQRNEMLNCKNAYLISIAVANNAKAQFYDISLPNLEDQFRVYLVLSKSWAKFSNDSLCTEQLQQRFVERFAKILQHSQSLQLDHLDSLKNRLSRVDAAFNRVDPVEDQNIFIDHNMRPFTAPDDWTFEPCITHYDTASKELDQLSSQFSSYTVDHTLGPIDQLTENLLEARHDFALCTSLERVLKSEEEIISSAIGASTTSSTHSSSDIPPNDLTARVLFNFTPTSEFELEVSEGETVRVVEADDGSGWVKVVNMQRRGGLVPASYLEHAANQTPATQGGPGQHVRAMYAYEAQGPDELGLIEGQTIELTTGSSGGQNYGSGWWEGSVLTPQGEGEYFRIIM
ncbi:hypothetical protein C0993_009310 [Termitomyces sp. T159_Od127]|nr:hypothetical protein C0993_009310 [Termitomyces sp. T159_Od127]